MIKHTMQLRRGWKWDSDPKTGQPRDDWAEYDSLPDDQRTDPLGGELVLEYDNGVPRLKIGTGNDKFGALPYMSVDSFILPTPASITLAPDAWQSVLDADNKPISDRYYQPVTVNNAIVTSNSKIDLQLSPEQLAVFAQKKITFTAINTGGNVRVCVVGERPVGIYVIGVTVTEVAEKMSEIIGNTIATPNPQPDWERTDETKADYIKNKPEGILQYIPQELTEEQKEQVRQNIGIGDHVIINSSTEGSVKKFKITVDDNGVISATEVTV